MKKIKLFIIKIKIKYFNLEISETKVINLKL